MNEKNACAFTGHRIGKLPWRGDENDARCVQLKQLIFDAVEAVYHAGVRHYICGMATGCDMYFCEAVLALREQRGDITLEAAVPWPGQSESWDRALRERYARLTSECDVQTVISRAYTPECMLERNKYMVDKASYLIAAYDGKRGGTQNTILYAIRSGLEIIQLPIE